MTCDERIEKLLNRAGQTISDLPEPSELSFAYSGKLEEAYSEAMKFSKDEEAKEYGYTELMLSDYIMHLTDIIDHFEWALENTCNERDYLRRTVCGLCSNFREDGPDACETCMIGEGCPKTRSVDDD